MAAGVAIAWYFTKEERKSIVGVYDLTAQNLSPESNYVDDDGDVETVEKEEGNEEKGKEEREDLGVDKDWKAACSELANLNFQPGRVIDGATEDSLEKIKQDLCEKYSNSDLFDEEDFDESTTENFYKFHLQKMKETISSYCLSLKKEDVDSLKLFEVLPRVVSYSKSISFVNIENPSFGLSAWAFLGKDNKWKFVYMTSWAANF